MKKIIKKVAWGAVAYGVCEVYFQLGKVSVLSKLIEFEIIAPPPTKNETKSMKMYPEKFVWSLATILAEGRKEK